VKRVFSSLLVLLSTLAARSESPRLSTVTPVVPRVRVAVVQDDAATETYKPVPDKIHALVQRGITNFARVNDPSAAWRTVVGTQDIVGIKVFSAPGPVGTRIAVVEGVIEGLLAAKVPTNHIIVWDSRLIDLRRAGFTELTSRYGIRVAGALDEGWDEKVFYESSLLGQLVAGDLEFQRKGETVARKSFVTKLLTKEITKIINVSPLLTHNSAGVCGNLYSLAMGSVDNNIRFEGDPGKLATVVPELYAVQQIGDRVVLNITDALICQFQGDQIAHLHYSIALNQLRFSTDPVALDVLSLEELQRQREREFPDMPVRTNRFELYRNAELLELGTATRSRIDVDLAAPK
jgi:hypothetical protein